MTRVHTHQVELTVQWPSAALTDNVLAAAMIAGLQVLYRDRTDQFAEVHVVSHSVLIGRDGLPEHRSAGAIARDGVGVNPVTSDGRRIPSPLQWDRPPPSAPASPNGHGRVVAVDGRVVSVEASPLPGYRPDLVHPQPPGQDTLGIPRTALTETESLVNGLRVRVEELAVAVGWLLKQTASHTHIESTGRATLATPPPQVEHR